MTKVATPEGWLRTSLGAVTRLRRDRVDPRSARGLTFVGLGDVEKDTGQLLSSSGADVKSQTTAFSSGDVLYARLRPNLNKVWRATFDGVCSTEFLVFRNLRNIDPDWLAFRLLADDVVAFASVAASSSLYPRISHAQLAAFKLAVPPLGEQTRIARRARLMLGRIREATEDVQQVGARTQAYRRSILQRAFAGELTADWRAEHPAASSRTEQLARVHQELERRQLQRRVVGRPGSMDARQPPRGLLNDAVVDGTHEDWLHVPWAAVGFEQSGRAFPSKHYVETGTRLLRPGNLAADGSIVWPPRATRRLPDALAAGSPDLAVGPGEVIMNLTAQSLNDDFLGRVCITSSDDTCILNQRLARLEVAGLSNRFLYHLLRSPQFRRYLEGQNTGSLIQHISIRQLGRFITPIPSEAEQAIIVERLDTALARIADAELAATEALERLGSLRRAIIANAAIGGLVSQDRKDVTVGGLLRDIEVELRAIEDAETETKLNRPRGRTNTMAPPKHSTIAETLTRLGSQADATALLDGSDYGAEDVGRFYEQILADPALLEHFKTLRGPLIEAPKVFLAPAEQSSRAPGHRFRLLSLWIGAFKNLRDYRVDFDPEYAIDIMLGWNGTGKSNLFEALVIIFRDLSMARGKLPTTDFAYSVRYEIGGRTVEVSWSPEGKRSLKAKASGVGENDPRLVPIQRSAIPLPRFVFGYYSGPTNRLAEHFLPLDREHYHRLVDSASDDPAEMLRLLEERRFFCAETHHAKYVMLGFFHKEDELISKFLRERLRILGFGAAVFVIRKPNWARPGEDATTFWGATGVVRHFLERLRRIAIAPLRIQAVIDEGFRQTREEQLHFLIPDAAHLRLLAEEYPNARTFFLALESADFSRMVREVKVSVLVEGENHVETPITFREMSEGEQQLLTVLGLLRFTRSHDSLVLLDEPDTHLNPHWSIDYLELLRSIMEEETEDLATSQILMSTHDPLVIVAQDKEQIHLLKRSQTEGRCEWRPASENPRGLGFTGILTSEMFGFGSDLDRPTLDLLHTQAVLAGKDMLEPGEQEALDQVTKQIDALGFRTASSDPYFRAFLQGVARSGKAATLLQEEFLEPADMAALAAETDEILAKIDAEEVGSA
ncbi:AAA family ATPase [Brevundimonas sp. NPDC092305]|uniref:AAA family ATPase n=1 Tax=Brevundimonas sp. NPDC092305 TaxID=3363957 RepID=UPI003819AF8F